MNFLVKKHSLQQIETQNNTWIHASSARRMFSSCARRIQLTVECKVAFLSVIGKLRIFLYVVMVIFHAMMLQTLKRTFSKKGRQR